jgi:glutathione S-transferase
MDMLRILGRVTSINVRKVLWALDELGLAYGREDWGMPVRDPKVPEFLALNPNGQVPVLVENQFVLWESNAILIYLAEREGQLLPEQLELRALALQWLGWQAAELNPPWGYAVNALIRRAMTIPARSRSRWRNGPARWKFSRRRWRARAPAISVRAFLSPTSRWASRCIAG